MIAKNRKEEELQKIKDGLIKAIVGFEAEVAYLKSKKQDEDIPTQMGQPIKVKDALKHYEKAMKDNEDRLKEVEKLLKGLKDKSTTTT